MITVRKIIAAILLALGGLTLLGAILSFIGSAIAGFALISLSIAILLLGWGCLPETPFLKFGKYATAFFAISFISMLFVPNGEREKSDRKTEENKAQIKDKIKEDFIANKAEIILNIQRLLESGNAKEAKETADRYRFIGDTSIESLLQKAEVKIIEARSQELVDSLSNIPEDDYTARRNVFRQLVELFPDYEPYKKNLDHYQQIIDRNIKNKEEIRNANTAYDKFLIAFAELNRKVENITGYRLFTQSRNLGDGMIEVTASDIWLKGTQAEKQANIQTIFNMWDAADGTRLPIAVYVVDKYGNRQMSKTRGL